MRPATICRARENGVRSTQFLDHVVVYGRTIQAEGGAAILDRGSGEATFDGLDVLAGQPALFWSGALRFMAGDGAAAACYDQNGNRVPFSLCPWR
jgi:hypothetical protein